MAGAGNIRKVGEGRYYVRIALGYDEDGNRLQHCKMIRGTKKDAERYMTGVLRERDMGRFQEPTKQTLGAYLDRWLETAARPRLRESTFNGYKDLLRLHVRPSLASVRLDKITPVSIQTLYGDLLQKGLSPRTVRYVHAVLSSALKQAVKWQMLTGNPAEYVDLPKARKAKPRPVVGEKDAAQAFRKAAIDCWRAATAPMVCSVEGCGRPALARLLCERHYASARRAKDLPAPPVESKWGLLLAFELVTGMRPGELQGLQWPDVDWEGSAVRVARSVEWVGSVWKFGDPKTPKSIRTITLPPSLLALLREHRTHQTEERLRLGPHYTNHGLIWAGPVGEPFDRRSVNRHLPRILKAAGLPEGMTMYGLRHSMATVLLSAGERSKIVSERMGHASVTLTLDTYSHVIPTMQRETASKLEDLVFTDPPKRPLP